MNNLTIHSTQSLLPELLANLDIGLLLCDIDDLKIIEYNQTFATWFNEIPCSETLKDLFEQEMIKRVNNAILKQRTYRFKLELTIGHRVECLDLSCKITIINEKN